MVRRKKNKNNNLGIVLIKRVNELFKNNEWEIDEEIKHSLYNRFINTLKNLDKDEQEIFLSLSEKFELIDFKEYQNKVIKLLEKAVKETCDIKKLKKKERKIYIKSLKSEKDENEIKSSDCISYLCKSTNIFYSDFLYCREFEVLGNINVVKNKISEINNKKILLIDDLVGTANYALEVVKELIDIGINKENIIVLTMYIHKIGLRKLQCENIKTIYLELLDDSNIRQLEDNELETLYNLEIKMKVPEDYYLGYKQSGCLVSLIRTPNNTLPVFWMNKHSGNAPFPRE